MAHRKDRRYGPTIYTITDQLVKPITAQAGGMSWALMRHPEGLKCDLFITHAWQEGIFEFIDKVLASWPRGLKHAWCCMLGLPQNLDISELIATPSSSPFAHALAFAPCMLVVPNHTGSIYTRLWCVYEAFLAYQWDKVVITARNRCSRKEWRVFPPVVLCLVLGAALSSFGRLSESCLAATASIGKVWGSDPCGSRESVIGAVRPAPASAGLRRPAPPCPGRRRPCLASPGPPPASAGFRCRLKPTQNAIAQCMLGHVCVRRFNTRSLD